MMKTTLTLLLLSSFSLCFSKNIYVDPQKGDDQNSGVTLEKPLRSLSALTFSQINSSDSILLKADAEHVGMIRVLDLNRSAQRPLYIGSYGAGVATINAKGYPDGVRIENSSSVIVENLRITADGGGMIDPADRGEKMRCGIRVLSSKPTEMGDVKIRQVTIDHVYYENAGYKRNAKEVKTANGTQSYGWGIRVISMPSGGKISNIVIDRCLVQQVSHTGVKFTGTSRNPIKQIEIRNSQVYQSGGPGLQFSYTDQAYIAYNKIQESGSPIDSRHWGRGSGMWTWGANDFLIEHNSFLKANGPGDSAGAHIDYNCNNIVLQYNLSAENAGGFVEILGNCYNCVYRYNLSVNDGYREKNKDGAFQEGKTLWLSGYVGEKVGRKGPFNSYIYNNTIYVSSKITAKMAVENSSVGALIANNIFYIEGESKVVSGDQYRPEKAGESQMKNICFRNNLYLRKGVLPKEYVDTAPLYGDPQFGNAGGLRLEDYIPSQKRLVRQGIEIVPLSGSDTRPDYLKVEKDLLGNPLKRSIIGAIAPVK